MHVSIFEIMLPAFVECLVLIGMHSYLGIHVIKRKVIFVDLSLAQIAALGTTVAFLFGLPPQSTGSYLFSLAFTFIGAAVFSLTRFRSEKIPQEAIIGLVFALSAAVAILVVDKAPHGAEHIKEMMTGNILWVKWKTIAKAAIIYTFIGIFHYVFRERFLLISNNPEEAYRRGWNIHWWDFLFYISFGMVITHSANTAGVLLVFVFLVVPAVATIMLTDKLWLQLVLGWSMGVVVSAIGLWVSYIADLPSGPTIVASYGVVLLVFSLVLYVVRASNYKMALAKLAMGFGVALLVAGIFYGMGKAFASQHSNEEHAPRLTAARKVTTSPKGAAQVDFFQKWNEIQKLYQNQPNRALQETVDFLASCPIPLLRSEALTRFQQVSGTDFGYDPFQPPEKNQAALSKMQQWLRSRSAGSR